jgi:hypothetical protein
VCLDLEESHELMDENQARSSRMVEGLQNLVEKVALVDHCNGGHVRELRGKCSYECTT